MFTSEASFAATTFTYDNLNRLTTADYGNGTSITYQYDAAGNVTRVQAVGSTVSTCTAINGASTVTVNVASSYSAMCVNTSAYVWKQNGVTISACTTPTCSVTFTATGANTLTVAPSAAQNNAASLAVTVSAAPTPTCSLITGPQSIAAAANSQTYTATCSNTSSYLWSLDGATIPACTTSTCSVNFPANTAASGVKRVVGVSPSANTLSTYRLPVGQAAASTPQCSAPISGPISVPATGGTFVYSSECSGATSYTWTLDGQAVNCAGTTCAITLPGNAGANVRLFVVGGSASNGVGSSQKPNLTVTVAAAPSSCSLDFNGDGAVNAIDALLFNRWLLGFRSAALVNGLSVYPVGTTVNAYATAVSNRMVLGLVHDFDNNGKVDATTDGLLLYRLTQNLTGTSVTSGALGAGALRNNHELIRAHVNTSCGTSFAAEPAALFDEFNSSALDANKWTEVRAGTGVATVSGGTVTFGAFASANTQGKVTFGGSRIVVEGRFTGLGASRDTTISIVDANNGDVIYFGDTNYFNYGFYSYGTGQLAFAQQNQGGTTSAYKEYRLTIDGMSVLIERGDTLANISQTRTATLPASIVGKRFYLRISTASPNYSPGTFDWVRVTTR